MPQPTETPTHPGAELVSGASVIACESVLGAQGKPFRATDPARGEELGTDYFPAADQDIDEVADLALELGLDGIIATNTTISRQGLETDSQEIEAIGAGGLSGAPLRQRALDVLERLKGRVGENLVLISVGGITTVDDAWQRIAAGATLVQVYSAFIFEGPGLPAHLAKGLVARARAEGYPTVADAVGANGRGSWG